MCANTFNNTDNVSDLSRLANDSIRHISLTNNETNVKFRNDTQSRVSMIPAVV